MRISSMLSEPVDSTVGIRIWLNANCLMTDSVVESQRKVVDAQYM